MLYNKKNFLLCKKKIFLLRKKKIFLSHKRKIFLLTLWLVGCGLSGVACLFWTLLPQPLGYNSSEGEAPCILSLGALRGG